MRKLVPANPHFTRPLPHSALVLLVLLLSLGVRAFGLGWGIPHYDPAYLRQGFDRPTYHLDEDNFIWGLALMHPAAGNYDVQDYHWGTLQFYLIDGVLLAGSVAGVIPAPWEAAFVDGDAAVLPRIYLLGRLVSLAAGVGATALVIALGTALGGRGAGLGAGLAYALAPLAVMEAHYLTNDVTMSALVAGMVLAAVRAVQRGSGRTLAVAGLLLGLAVTAKYSAAFAAPGLLVAQGGLWPGARAARRPGPWLAWGLGPWVAAAGGFLLGEPAALLIPATVWRGMRSATDATLPPLLALPATALAMLRQQVPPLGRLALTPPVAVLALGGLAWLVWCMVRARAAPTAARWAAAVLPATVAGLLVSVAINTVPMLRYTQPLIPLLAVAAGLGWAALPPAALRAAAGLCALAWAGVITAGQLALLVEPHPADRLAAWIAAQVPPGAQIARPWREYPPLVEARYRLYRLEPWRPALPADLHPDYVIADDMMGAPDPTLPARLAAEYHEVARFATRPHVGSFAWDEGPTPHDWKYSHPSFIVYARRQP